MTGLGLMLLVVVVMLAFGGLGFNIVPGAVADLRRKRKDVVDRMTPLAEKATLSAEEEKLFGELRTEAESLGKSLERAEYVAGLRDKITAGGDPPPPRTDPNADPKAKKDRGFIPNPGFENIGEILAMAVLDPADKRIRELRGIRAEMSMGTGAKGGLAVPTELDPTIRAITPQESVFLAPGRATVIPAGDAPEADFVVLAAKQGGANDVHAGVAVAWVDEGGAKPETDTDLREVKFSPKEVAAHIVVTDKLLRNWAAASSYLGERLRRALLAAKDKAFLTGNGVGKPKGVLNLGCLKKVNRAGAGTVAFADLGKMEDELLELTAPAVWIINPRVRGKLRIMEDTEGHLIWQENARDGAPGTLLGRQVIVNFRSPTLGTLGDVVLAVLPDYTVKDGVGTTLAVSEHVHFLNNKTVIKAFASVDGGSELDVAVKQEDGLTYSPFVALDVP